MITKQTAIKLEAMSYEALMVLNKYVVSILRHRQTEIQLVAAAEFRVGQVVGFNKRTTGGLIRIRIEKINAKSLQGRDVKTNASWRVAPSFCRAVTK